AATFLRLELVSNNVRDFRLKKSLAHWEAMRQRFQQITDRFAGVQAQNLNVHGQFDVLARLAQPVIQGKTKVSGIKLEQKRILRLLEVLLQGPAATSNAGPPPRCVRPSWSNAASRKSTTPSTRSVTTCAKSARTA